MNRLVLDFLRDDRGASSAEYALLASLVAGVIFAATATFGLSVLGLFQKAGDALTGAS